MDRLQRAVARAREKNEGALKAYRNHSNDLQPSYEDVRVIPISQDELSKRRVIAGLSRSAHSHQFKTLRTKLLSEMLANGWRTIAVAGATYGQGKSTIVANLAVAIAMEAASSVLAVDLDLKRPNLHRVFGLPESYGLSDVLRGDKEVLDVIVNPGIERLSILPGNERVENSSELMSDPSTLKLFSELREQSGKGIVIYDLPALLDSDDALKSIKNFDCSLLVIKDGENTSDEVIRSIEILKRTNYIGYVLNMSRL